MESVKSSVVKARYTLLGEALRYVIPGHMICSVGCGGRACKYEDPSRWSEADQAIRGLYSTWITDELLAMARPSTEILEKYQVIDQFHRCGVRSLMNLQQRGEHADCGNALVPESGFTYRPESFMEAGIYFYNFEWNDYGVAPLTTILDMVKVMCFALQEGKMAVHCHAGLGRTGVLLACFLVYTSRMTADEAISFVRSKRPRSIQTRRQLVCVRRFAEFLQPLRSVFSGADPVTLSQFLIRQKRLLHGHEARRLRCTPKLVTIICRLLVDIAENRQVIEEDVLEVQDVTSDDESSVSYSTRPRLDTNSNIMMGGVAFNLPRLPGPSTTSRNDSQQPLHYARKSFSYSDSDLRRLADTLNLCGNPADASSRCNSGDAGRRIGPHGTLKDLASYTSCSSLWDLKTGVAQEDGLPVPPSRRQSVLQRSQSLGVSTRTESRRSFSTLLAWLKHTEREGDCEGNTSAKDSSETKHDDEERSSEVPIITIQSELTLEARRLLVAQSLAVDLSKDGKDEHVQKVSDWQTNLNHQGAFEALCLEKDPFVLAGILWSWFEQLKEPVLSITDVQTLIQPNPEPKTLLNPLERAQRETLVCILDCFAHLLVIPEEVEAAFMERLIKAFTRMENVGDGRDVYQNMTGVLTRVLRDMRRNAMDELDTLP
ncbi:protein tyrosine phosphatase domain-containing protein 1 [Trichomycterus rosablanca]|uniref:protein tyrosine phosphatase domain-containing protein 1 n=1 Tax=Trichomycterus rosablanca TaxID=2290929 RepID=UPI002F34FF8C